MAERRDRVMEELKAIRRNLSDRLHKAHQRGSLVEEVARLDREGMQAFRASANGSRNGHSRKNGRKKR